MTTERSTWGVLVTLRARDGKEPVKEFWPARIIPSRRNPDPGSVEVVKDAGPYQSLASAMWAVGTDLALRASTNDK